MDEPTKGLNEDNQLDTLENSTTVVEPTAGTSTETAASDGDVKAAPDDNGVVAEPGSVNGSSSDPKPPHRWSPRTMIRSLNIYMLVFILVVVLALAAATVLYLQSKKQVGSSNTLTSQTLSQSTLEQLANSDVTVGDPKQVLNVQSNAVFAGKVLVRDSLEIAGKLQVGGDLALTGVRVSGQSTFDDVQVTKSLAVTGNGSFQGQLNVQKSLSVNGGATFNGAVSAPQLTVNTLQLNGDLNLTHHIAAGGATPTRTNGTALGSGGTASVGGSDTAGSITIHTGGSPGPGCFLTVNFTSRFNSTPHIIITPVGSAAGALDYYINRSTSNFSVCTTTSAPASSTFGFDYVAFD